MVDFFTLSCPRPFKDVTAEVPGHGGLTFRLQRLSAVDSLRSQDMYSDLVAKYIDGDGILPPIDGEPVNVSATTLWSAATVFCMLKSDSPSRWETPEQVIGMMITCPALWKAISDACNEIQAGNSEGAESKTPLSFPPSNPPQDTPSSTSVPMDSSGLSTNGLPDVPV